MPPEQSEDQEFSSDADAFFANLTGEPTAAPEGDAEDAGLDGFDADGKVIATPAAASEETVSEDPDDAEMEWGEGDAKSKASLKDLKAAFKVREESTKFAQEAATARAEAVAQATKASASLAAMVQKAGAKWEPFSKLDFLALSKDPNISSEDFTALRAAAQEALTEYRYLTTEQEGAAKTQQEAAAASKKVAVEACIAELNGPNGITGFGRELYGKLVDHAETTYGAPRAALMDITAPWAVRALNDAMLYRQGLVSAETKVVKVVNKATKVLRPGAATGSDTKGLPQAMKNLRASGSTDDAEAAFLASFGA